MSRRRQTGEGGLRVAVTLLGPLRLTFPGGRGPVTYPRLGRADAALVEEMVAAAIEHYRAEPTIRQVEWKTRGPDQAPGLDVARSGLVEVSTTAPYLWRRTNAATGGGWPQAAV